MEQITREDIFTVIPAAMQLLIQTPVLRSQKVNLYVGSPGLMFALD